MKNTKPILILGGMGPQASVILHQTILRHSRQFHTGKPNEYPSVIHMSLQIPDFISSVSNENKAIAIINNAMQKVATQELSLTCIACNTAHNLLHKLHIDPRTFVSMIQSTVDQVVKSGIKSVGLIASPNTLRSGLYEKPLLAAGVRVIKPTSSELLHIEDVIRAVINGTNTSRHKRTLSVIAESMQKKGADGIVLGCTELPIVGITTSLQTIDSIDELAKSIVKQHYLVY